MDNKMNKQNKTSFINSLREKVKISRDDELKEQMNKWAISLGYAPPNILKKNVKPI